MPGLRRSPSTITVLSPSCASVYGQIRGAVCFPSLGSAL